MKPVADEKGGPARGGSKTPAMAALLMALLLLALIPLLWAGGYARPSADDFFFSQTTHPIWLETHSLGAVCAEGLSYAHGVYEEWQGSFSACFLMTLQPGLFAEKLYGLSALMLIGALIIGNALLCRALLYRALGFSRAQTLALFALITLVSIELVPSGTESFFWFNGSVYYTFFYSLALMLAAGLISDALSAHRGFSARCVILPALAFFIGGGNLNTGLTLAVLLAGYLAVLALKKRCDWTVILTAAGFFAGFLLNVCAPGNAVRQGVEGPANGPAAAILLAIANAVRFAFQWTSPYLLIAALAGLPIYTALARRTGFAYRAPLIVTAASVLIIAVGFTPQLYAQGRITGYRSLNIGFYLYVLLFFLNAAYWTGWALRRLAEPGGFRALARRFCIPACLVLFGLIGVAVLSARYPIYEKGIDDFTSVQAAKIVVSGEGESYAAGRDAWAAELSQTDAEDVSLHELRAQPQLLNYGLPIEDEKFWINMAFASYYGKRSVRVLGN